LKTGALEVGNCVYASTLHKSLFLSDLFAYVVRIIRWSESSCYSKVTTHTHTHTHKKKKKKNHCFEQIITSKQQIKLIDNHNEQLQIYSKKHNSSEGVHM
jgi:hypothetical protein